MSRLRSRDVVARPLLWAGLLYPVVVASDALAEHTPMHVLPSVVVAAPRAKVAVRKPKPPTRTATMRATPRRAADVPRPAAPAASAATGAGAALPTLSRWSPTTPDGRPAFVERFQLPNTVASVTRRDIADRINITDTEHALKYMPSLFVRKRVEGDNQAVIATRTWGVNSSARSLVYADDILLTALIGNDNTIGAPRWGMVAPEEIERVDFLYGPFSAAYPGNALGGVLQITTRMPEKLEVTAKQTESLQTYNLYGTNRTYLTSTTSVTAGDRIGDFSWFLAGRFAANHTQPLTYTTTPSAYPYPGSWAAYNKVGNVANVLGALGQLDNQQVTGKLKLAYDFTPSVRATYQVGIWSSDSNTFPQSFAGSFGPPSGPAAFSSTVLQSFGAGYYRWQEQMLANTASIRSASNGFFDFDISAANFTYLKSDQISPFSALPAFGVTPNGKDSRFGGTYWNNFDAKGILRPEFYGRHEISFGLHADEYHLNNPVWLTTNWTAGPAASIGLAASNAQGTTRTQALWAQDAWRFHPDLKLTLGGRWENWSATGGYNQQLAGLNALGTGFASTPANVKASMPIWQPALYHARFSPKASLQWTPDDAWTLTGSIGLANRFPTVKELYNLTTLSSATGVIANPNPNLLPEVALSSEIAVKRAIGLDGWVRVSLFNEDVRDAIISQNIFVPAGAVVASNTNVGKVRNRGVELAFAKDNVLIERFELQGSATFVDSRILSDPTWAGGSAANNDLWNVSPVGKNAPLVPKWRWTLVGTYRPDDHWSMSLAGRWQGRMWSTLSNNDVVHNVYGAFDRFFVADLKIAYKVDERASFSFGVDNLNNAKYFLFHPFPQRTFSLSGRYQLGSAKADDIGIFRPL